MINILEELSDLIGETGTKVLGFGVIAFKDSKEVYSKFSGFSNVEKKIPITRYTRFRVASVSKMFTVFTIMQLVEQGKINLDTDVSEYLGFKLRNPNFPNTPITVRMLASHTSTLRDDKVYSLPPNCDIEDFFKPNNNSIHFGSKGKNFFTYCNLNYGILGTIIERITNERFDIYQKNHILKQLNINADYVVGNLCHCEFENLGTIYQKNQTEEWIAQIDNYTEQPAKDMVLVQNPYVKDTDSEFSLQDYKIGTNATIFSPQGGLRISFDELAHCLEMILNRGIYNDKRVISIKSLYEIIKPQWIYDEINPNGETYGVMFNYGLGMYQINGASKARLCKDYEIDLIGHSGEAYGMISGFYFTPNMNNGVLFMINGTAIKPDEDKLSFGKFSNSYIWEENIMNPICKYIFF